MLGIVGYNFLADVNALDPISVNISNITNLKMEQGIFDHVNLTQDVTSAMSTTIPTDWTSLTLLDCNFDNILLEKLIS